jgi:O-antigen/teichoic acid export membrane protein
MPAVANLVGTGEQDRIRRGFWRATRILTLLVPPLVAGVAVTGPALLRAIYGERYAGAGAVLLVMLVPLLIQPIMTLSMAVLYGLGRPRFIIGAGLAATVVDLALALLLIPRWDAVGAAVANGAAQLVAGLPCLALVVRLHRPALFSARDVLRGLGLGAVVAAGSSAVLLTLGTGTIATLAAVLAGGLAVLLVAMILRPVDSDDARWLAAALGSSGRLGQAGRFVLRLAPPERP